MLLFFLRVTTPFFVEAQGFLTFLKKKRVELLMFHVLLFVGRHKAICEEARGLAGPV